MRTIDALGLELAAIARPTGRILLAGQVPALSPLLEFPSDARAWMRWAEPDETGLESVRIEIATATPRDEQVRTARVVARATPTNRRIAWGVYNLLEIQGLTDLLVVGPAEPDGSPSELVHLLVCADLTRRSEGYGLSVHHFPKYYV